MPGETIAQPSRGSKRWSQISRSKKRNYRADPPHFLAHARRDPRHGETSASTREEASEHREPTLPLFVQSGREMGGGDARIRRKGEASTADCRYRRSSRYPTGSALYAAAGRSHQLRGEECHGRIDSSREADSGDPR